MVCAEVGSVEIGRAGGRSGREDMSSGHSKTCSQAPDYHQHFRDCQLGRPSLPVFPPTPPQNLTGWNIRAVFEDTQPDLLETEAFFMAFARVHNLDGHKIMCVMTPAKHQQITASYEHEGLTHSQSVLIVSKLDMQGISVNDTLRIDGDLYVIDEVSYPSGDIVRMVLSRNA